MLVRPMCKSSLTFPDPLVEGYQRGLEIHTRFFWKRVLGHEKYFPIDLNLLHDVMPVPCRLKHPMNVHGSHAGRASLPHEQVYIFTDMNMGYSVHFYEGTILNPRGSDQHDLTTGAINFYLVCISITIISQLHHPVRIAKFAQREVFAQLWNRECRPLIRVEDHKGPVSLRTVMNLPVETDSRRRQGNDGTGPRGKNAEINHGPDSTRSMRYE